MLGCGELGSGDVMPDLVVLIAHGVVMMYGIDLHPAGDSARQGVRRGHLGPEKEKDGGAEAPRGPYHGPSKLRRYSSASKTVCFCW